VTLRTLLEAIAGGTPDGRSLKGALVGGPSGSIVPAPLFDVPMEPRGRVSPGTGGVVAVPEDAAVAGIVRTLIAFNARESCGKCTPCREGLPRLLALLDEPDRDEGRLRDLAETIQSASLCGLGQAAPLSLLRALEAFGGEVRGRR
jgi:NADH:ubiquinone oxidoreductase subunit F (NADH-binding)